MFWRTWIHMAQWQQINKWAVRRECLTKWMVGLNLTLVAWVVHWVVLIYTVENTPGNDAPYPPRRYSLKFRKKQRRRDLWGKEKYEWDRADSSSSSGDCSCCSCYLLCCELCWAQRGTLLSNNSLILCSFFSSSFLFFFIFILINFFGSNIYLNMLFVHYFLRFSVFFIIKLCVEIF